MRSNSILDIDALVDDTLIPPIEKVREWLNKNALKGYLDNVSHNGGRRFVPHYDDKKMNTYTVYCINIIHID